MEKSIEEIELEMEPPFNDPNFDRFGSSDGVIIIEPEIDTISNLPGMG